jgi:hypothetical protein
VGARDDSESERALTGADSDRQDCAPLPDHATSELASKSG